MDSQYLTPGLSRTVSELNVELSGILSISSLSCLLVAWPPKLAMAVRAIVLMPWVLLRCFLCVCNLGEPRLREESSCSITPPVAVRNADDPSECRPLIRVRNAA